MSAEKAKSANDNALLLIWTHVDGRVTSAGSHCGVALLLLDTTTQAERLMIGKA